VEQAVDSNKKKKKEKEFPWYEIDEVEDNIIQAGMAHARKEFHKFLTKEFKWDGCKHCHPLLRLEVRGHNHDDGGLGKAYCIDEIQEFEELIDCCDEDEPQHFKEPKERKEIQ